ncbi:helix-turn-helix domain-containing protein [Aliarcobacter cryaerophilus]|uniref:helix-turn-helix domain-containing protein n=1 Tax=Aliarcobacter cryaerophilus TaxID=28198 RepID=UPI0009E9B9A3|nr:helix-turn-helix domain-containing protein [Aliarcobacter cryaerophilus]
MPHSINEAIFLIEKLLNYYNLTSLQELAEKLNIKQSSLSSWKSRNSIKRT